MARHELFDSRRYVGYSRPWNARSHCKVQENSLAGSSLQRPAGNMSAIAYNGMGSLTSVTGAALAPLQALSIAVFLLAAAIMFYALFGYPLLLRWMARRANNPVHRDDKLRTVSFVIAVYNGEKFLERKLKTILSLNYPREQMDILVVSDGSTDRTDEIARSFAGQGVRFLRVPHGGKAAALNAGVALMGGEILVLCDVRQTLEPNCLRRVIACFGDPKVGAVSPKTVIVEGDRHEEATTSAYWRYEDWIRRHLTLLDSTFGYSGAFAALRRSLWTPLPPGTLLDDVYVPLKAFFQGYRILYEPTATMYDYPTVLHSEFRRKVRLQAGLYQMLKIMPELLSSRNRMRFHFLSAKYGRIVIPYCMIAIGLATIGLPAPWRAFAAWGQVLFYGLAAIDPLVPDHFPLKKLTSPISTFVVLMAASLAAVRVYFVKPTSLWKEASYRNATTEQVARSSESSDPKVPTSTGA
jgi:cellulose synthase/poly-beta-1,6-N-acetylglucosamine synthase-like glycosyltransferase